MTDLLEP